MYIQSRNREPKEACICSRFNTKHNGIDSVNATILLFSRVLNSVPYKKGVGGWVSKIIMFVILSCKILEFDWLRNIWQKILLPQRVHRSHPLGDNPW
jgi:hypothetical protein